MQLHDLKNMYLLQLPDAYVAAMWQPWVQNYHGQYSLGYAANYSFVRYIWVDKDMKKKITGR